MCLSAGEKVIAELSATQEKGESERERETLAQFT